MRKQKVYITVVILLFLTIIGTAILFITKDKEIEITATYQDFTEKDIIYDQGYLYVDSQFLLTAKADSTYEEVEKLIKRYNAEIVGYISISNDYQIALPSGTEYAQLCEIVDELNHNERVELCTLNYVYPMEEASVDYTKDPWVPASDSQDKSGSEWSEIKVQGANWWAEAVKLPSVWSMDIWNDDSQFVPVNIGVIDSVFDTENTDLKQVFKECWLNPIDGSGRSRVSNLYNKETNAEKKTELAHGTHVAGIIAAKGENNFGITGTASCADPQLYGYATKGERDQFYTDLMMWKYAIALMLKEDVKVINISMGFESLTYAASKGNDVALLKLSKFSVTMERFLKKCIEQNYDFIITTSAGNTAGYGWKECEASKEYPYGYIRTEGTSKPCDIKFDVFGAITDTEVRNHIIIVGATKKVQLSFSKDTKYEIADFSNIGADVYAPGYKILSTIPGNTTDYRDGTSMASPIVAGTAALMWSVNPELGSRQIKEIIVDSTETDDADMSNVNAYYAVNAARIEKGSQGTEKKNKGCVLGQVYTWVQDDTTDDTEELLLEGAEIHIYDEDNEEISKVKSDQRGSFEIFLSSGSYVLRVQKEGYTDYELKVELKKDEVVYHPFEMKPVYEWVVEPEIIADNIFYMKDTAVGDYSYNELHRQFMNNYAVIMHGGKYGLIDMNGEFLAEPEYDRISLQMDSYYVDNGQPENSYYVTATGEIVPGTEPALAVGIEQQPSAFYYSDGLHHVLENAGDLLEPLDRPDAPIPVQIANSDVPLEGNQKVFWDWWKQLDGKYAIYNTDSLVSKFSYDKCGSCSVGLFAVCKDGKWGYVDSNGESVISMTYDASWEEYSEDDTGNIDTSQSHDKYCYGASGGYIVLKKGNQWELRDIEGNLIIPSDTFDKICPVYNGQCWVKLNGKWGVIKINKPEGGQSEVNEKQLIGAWINEDKSDDIPTSILFKDNSTADFVGKEMTFYDAPYWLDGGNLFITILEADSTVTLEIDYLEESEQISMKAIESEDASILKLIQENMDGTYKKHTSKVTSETYQKVYGPILEEVCKRYGDDNIYYCYDVDKDGIKELMVQEGNDFQSSVFKIYTISNEKSVYLGEVSGFHCEFYCDESGGKEPYIIRSEVSGNYSKISYISIEKGEIVEKVVSETEDGKGYSGSYHITCMDVAYDDLLEARWYE